MKLIGNILIVVGIALIVLVFFPVAKEEIKYDLNKALNIKYSVNTPEAGTFEKPLTPPNTDFSIVIPKIAATAPVIANVDPSNPKIYLSALKKGVAQAKGTALPGKEGNVYLFAHSTDTFWNVSTYNAIFFLIGKLQKGDQVIVYYLNKKYTYSVNQVKVVDAKDSQYFGKIMEGKTLTLQTCYPPGTTLKRLIVTAIQDEND